jgi:phage terminase small subunit
MIMKLTRKDIKQGLQDMPIDTLLLGQAKTLTAKQKAFAEALAKTGNKAEAYRRAYNTNSSPKIQSEEGQRLAKNPVIAMQVEAIKVSLEAQKYLLPAHLRALTIQKLTEKALDPDVNHAQQIKALELLGKITEVSLFTERKEITSTDTSANAKDRLIQSLAQAIRSSSNITSAKKAEANSLLNEITGGSLANPKPETIEQGQDDISGQDIQEEGQVSEGYTPSDNDNMMTPPPATASEILNLQADYTHTIPDKQSAPITETPPLSFTESEWGGVDKFWETFEKVDKENTPLDESGSHTHDGDNSNE